MATEILRPTGTDWAAIEGVSGATYHWQAVDDSSPDDDSTYIYETRYNASRTYYDSFTFGSMAETADISISSVKVYARLIGSFGTQVAEVYVQPASTRYYSSWLYATTSYNTSYYEWTTNPETGVAWTKDDINNLLVGLYLRPNNNQYERCTQVYVVVDYAVVQEKFLAGGITPDGALNRKMGVEVAGSVLSSGSVDRDVESGLGGSATPYGTVNRTIGIQLGGKF